MTLAEWQIKWARQVNGAPIILIKKYSPIEKMLS